jgi:caa(3)-type oxidase subunit IV
MSEAKTEKFTGYAVYWRTWGFLLALTVVMFVIDSLSMPRLPFVVLMVSVMLLKVVLIASIFMHLRDESRDLALMVGFCGLFFGAILYGLLVPDALRIAAMLGR